MKTSITHFKNSIQEELTVLVEIIKEKVSHLDKVILFGSYAKGTHVLWDDKIEFGTHTTFQSDYDILVVISKGDAPVVERMLRDNVADRYHAIFTERRQTNPDGIVRWYAPPSFVVERTSRLNKELEYSRYFFTDVVKEGIMLYDSGEGVLADPKDLSYADIKRIALEEFNAVFPDGNGFLYAADALSKIENYKLGSFQLHQACERYYNAIRLVFENYRGKGHDLKDLLSKVKKYSPELVTVFPESTPFETRCYNLIWRAYIEARYNPKFVVTKEEFEYMLARTEVLRDIVESATSAQFAVYDKLIADEG